MEQINNNKAIEFLLMREWEKEFEVIDKVNQHKDGLSFDDWCRKKGIVMTWSIKR